MTVAPAAPATTTSTFVQEVIEEAEQILGLREAVLGLREAGKVAEKIVREQTPRTPAGLGAKLGSAVVAAIAGNLFSPSKLLADEELAARQKRGGDAAPPPAADAAGDKLAFPPPPLLSPAVVDRPLVFIDTGFTCPDRIERIWADPGQARFLTDAQMRARLPQGAQSVQAGPATNGPGPSSQGVPGPNEDQGTVPIDRYGFLPDNLGVEPGSRSSFIVDKNFVIAGIPAYIKAHCAYSVSLPGGELYVMLSVVNARRTDTGEALSQPELQAVIGGSIQRLPPAVGATAFYDIAGPVISSGISYITSDQPGQARVTIEPFLEGNSPDGGIRRTTPLQWNQVVNESIAALNHQVSALAEGIADLSTRTNALDEIRRILSEEFVLRLQDLTPLQRGTARQELADQLLNNPRILASLPANEYVTVMGWVADYYQRSLGAPELAARAQRLVDARRGTSDSTTSVAAPPADPGAAAQRSSGLRHWLSRLFGRN